MAIELSMWNALTANDKNDVVSFLRGNCKIDHESPQNSNNNASGTYPIAEGTTSGGYPMKYGDEYRIYIKDLTGCPSFLSNECKKASKPYVARIGGNEAIGAIMRYGSFQIGVN